MFSCSQNKLFTVEKNGVNQPFEKVYKIDLSNDTLYLNARSNLKIEGEYFRVLDNSEKKLLLEEIEKLNLNNINNSNGGSNYIFYYKDNNEEVNVYLTGMIPKECKLFVRELENMIGNSNWIKIE